MHHLLRIASEGGEREIPVDRDYLIIGRDPSACHVLLDNDVVSRRHAAVELDAQGNVTVVDLASTNGTFVNGAAVDRRVLREGDTISFGPVGQVDLRYSISPVAPVGETVRLPPTGEAVMPPDGAQTFVAPAETVPLANLPIPPPFTVTMSEREQKQEGRAVGAICAACSSPLEAGGTFCSSCGAPASQATTVVCPQCGQSVGESAKFCKYCAHKLPDPALGAAGASYVSASPQPVHAPAAAPQLTPPAPAFTSLPSVGVGGQQRVVVAEPYSSQSRPATVPQVGLTSAPIHYAPTLTPPVPAQHTTQAAGGNGGAWLTPTGAGIAAICFFLPWVQFSCGGYSRSVSGADIASRDGSLWIVPGAAVVILGTYFIFKAQRRLAASRPLTIISSLAGGALLIFKGIEFSQPQQTMFGTISPHDLGLSLQPGALGTLGGLGLAFLGALLTRAAPHGSPLSQSEGGGSGNRHPPTGAAGSAPAARVGIKLNVIGMLCYAGLPPLGILWMLAAAVLLAAEPHRRDRFVRFHVFQTLFLGAALFALSMFFFLVGVAGGGLLVLMAGIGPCAFLAHKAYANETPRLPLVGDLAARLADQGGGTPRQL